MSLKIYLDPCTINCRKVLAGMKLMDAPFEEKFVSFFKGEQKSPENTKLNPSATVPFAIVDDDLNITESNAILQYVADANGGSKYYPADLKQRATVNRWLFWESSVWFATCYVYLVDNVVQPLLGNSPSKEVIDKEAPQWNKLAKILDDQLGKTKWIAGDQITIADIAIGSPMHLWEDSKMPVENYPNLHRWYKALAELPAWAETQGPVDSALVPNKNKNKTNGAASTNSVNAIFNYTKDLGAPSEIYFYEDPRSAHIHEPGDDPHEMPVHDGWDQADQFSVDKHGFALKPFDTKFNNWEAEQQVANDFYPEVVEFLKKTLGAKRVLVFDHTIRSKANLTKKLTQETNTSQRAPVKLVHCDYTADSGPLRVKQLLPNEADDLLSRRVAFINVWKPLHRTVEENPLAMCDVHSSPPDDFMLLLLRYRDRNGQNYVMRHSPNHKWYYFPKMTTDKVILLKTYDSDTSRAQYVGHSAFDDPTSPADAPTRESCEIRTICFF